MTTSPREPSGRWRPPLTVADLRAVPAAVGLAVWALAKVAVTVLPAYLLWPQYVAMAGTTVVIALPAARLIAIASRRLRFLRGPEALPAPYLPLPRIQQTANGWWWNGYDFRGSRAGALVQRRGRWFFTDPAMWRDLFYLFADPVVGAAVFAVPLGSFAYAGFLLVTRWGLLSAGAAVALVAVGVCTAPLAVRTYRGWLRRILKQSPQARLAQKAESLFAQRGEAIDAQAAELRRIERDLHDGAQARLVSIGMMADAAESLVRTDPDAAARTMGRVRELAAEALRELRDLVHGMHPPILAERGLDGAVEALAYAVPLSTTVQMKLTGRAPDAVESTAYLVVSELLTNVVKHSRARHATVELTSVGTDLHIVVSDDGVGGADLSTGTGLRGVQRRLAVFGGVLECQSPIGGGTTIRAVLPGAMPATEPAR